MIQDIRYAFRALAKTRTFTLLAVAMLALGIAANTAIFSIFNGLFLRQFPFSSPEQLVDVDEMAPKWNLEYVSVSYPDFVAWRAQTKTFRDIAAYDDQSANLSGLGDPVRIETAAVTYNMTNVLGIKPLLGRDFAPADDKLNAPGVVLMTYGLWQRKFGGDKAVIGRLLQLDQQPYTVIGILPKEAVFPARAQLWTTLRQDPDKRMGWWLNTVGRLRPGATMEQANADLTRIHKSLIPTSDVNKITAPRLTPLRARFLGDYRAVSIVLLCSVAVVLLIACINIAGLMLARSTTRARELALRSALGASSGRIIRQLLTESVLLAAMGGAAGAALGSLALEGLLSLMPDVLPTWVTFELDIRFLLFSLFLIGLSAILFGLAPAFQASRVDIRGSLQDSSRTTLSGSKHRGLQTIVAGEIALALGLLISAGLLVQAFRKILSVDPGFRTENVLTYTVSLPDAKYAKPEQRFAFFDELLSRQRAMPGVVSVGAVTATPLGGHWGNFFEVEGSPPLTGEQQDPVVLQRFATEGYFETMGIRMLAGRTFREDDGLTRENSPVIVNESFANRYWKGQNPIGKRLRGRGSDKNPWNVVIGVNRDTKHYGLDQPMRPGLFFPYRVLRRGMLAIVVHTSVDPNSLIAPARGILHKLDADLPMFQIRTIAETMNRSLWMRRASSWLFGIFSGVALLLAAAGVYGVLSYVVSQRTQEIGIRMALGAQPGQVLTHVLRQGMLPVSAGILLGLGLAAASGRLLESMLFGVSTRDLATYASLTAGLLLVAVFANLVPARKASSVDPASALRSQ